MNSVNLESIQPNIMPKLKDFKERELISIITDILNSDYISNELIPPWVVGPGKDDCAVIDIGAPQLLVTSTDMLHSSTDFPPGMTAWQMGWMSVAVNLSDIAAMGARPIGIMTALGLPPDTELDFVKALVEGMNACARQQATHIIGGDIDKHDELTIVGSAMGLVKRAHLVLRAGAQVGDYVCVTGELGTAGAALNALEHNKTAYPYVLRKLYLPIPRIVEGTSLAATGCLTSMMDISDGLALSLHDIAASSNVGFQIRVDDLPVHRTVKKMAADKDQLIAWSLYTGGDFELLFTVKADGMEKIKKAGRFTVIGKVTEKDILIEHNGHMEMVEARGFQQFGDKL
jgi:thiamine-monophosphate kinase